MCTRFELTDKESTSSGIPPFRLTELERDLKISKVTTEPYNRQKVEILLALRKLGDDLSPAELAFIETHSSASMKQFEKVCVA